ncbi:MAG: TonB-dependent receptor, partial [Acidobacteria bacterium]|nr:TonB-dependent receptor [Acidobacteriota bacterium]
LNGYKGFLSYGDRLGKLSLYSAYSHLRNDSQAMTFLFSGAGSPQGSEIVGTGALTGTDEYGQPVRYYGNTGAEDSLTQQLKLKLGYDLTPSWFLLFNTGFEARQIDSTGTQNYLLGPDGNPIWEGRVVQGGTAFDIAARDFSVSDLERQSLLLGARLQGLLSDRWHVEAGVSHFDVLKDVTQASLRNPADPAFTPAGTLRGFDEAGWETLDVRLQNDGLAGNDRLSLTTGYRYEQYGLSVTNFNSADYAAGERTSLNNSSGGDSWVHAAFAQLTWRLSSNWELTAGGRLESWATDNGFFNDRGNLEQHVDRSENRFSPKLSLAYVPAERWLLRLSTAKAYRFPIVEELFQNERRTNGTSIANADLEPEDGLHYNLMVERLVTGGHVRLNLFTETVKDVIFNQASIVDNRRISTFLPIDEVVTDGAELVFNQRGLASGKLLLRFNAAYTDAEITRNRPNPDLEGKVFPRMPRWRSNLLLNYQLTDRWDLGGGVRYSSDSYGDLDNSDTADNVFGAHDAFTQLNLRSSFDVREDVRLSFGIDNLTDEIAYVHHPWPGRTFFLEIGVNL